MKALFLFSFMMLAGVVGSAWQVVACSGNTATSSGYTVAWSLGKPVIEILTGANKILTQGIHQTNLVVTCKIIKN
jgi:hypothetical protein